MTTSDQLAEILPLACQWVAQQEQMILHAGVPLTPAQLADARQVGLRHPERVRLLSVPAIPRPEEPRLQIAAQAARFLTPGTIGLTLRYGIYLHADYWGDRALLAHELVHSAQYERLGGIEPFLRRYFGEVLAVGYARAPLEQEAVRVARRLIKQAG
jgi:hypothetical protein